MGQVQADAGRAGWRVAACAGPGDPAASGGPFRPRGGGEGADGGRGRRECQERDSERGGDVLMVHHDGCFLLVCRLTAGDAHTKRVCVLQAGSTPADMAKTDSMKQLLRKHGGGHKDGEL